MMQSSFVKEKNKIANDNIKMSVKKERKRWKFEDKIRKKYYTKNWTEVHELKEWIIEIHIAWE